MTRPLSLSITGIAEIPDKGLSAAVLPWQWPILALSVAYTGTETTIGTGTVLYATYDGSPIYRHITTAETGGYPDEDAFYLTFEDGVLSNKVAQRGQ